MTTSTIKPATAAGFGDRLYAAMRSYGPVCVGIDPHAGLLQEWGLDDDANGVREFSLRVVEALGGRVAAFKPQAAFFERHGSRGVAVLEEVIAACREVGTLATPSHSHRTWALVHWLLHSSWHDRRAGECSSWRSPPTPKEPPFSTPAAKTEPALRGASYPNWRTLTGGVINNT